MLDSAGYDITDIIGDLSILSQLRHAQLVDNKPDIYGHAGVDVVVTGDAMLMSALQTCCTLQLENSRPETAVFINLG